MSMDGSAPKGDSDPGNSRPTASSSENEIAWPMNLRVESGKTIAGKYVVETLLGQGGMGAVFTARQQQLNRHVAIKFLLPIANDSAGGQARFEREAQAAAALQSEHVPRVYDFGHLETGEPYIVMELLKGEDLAKLLERRGRLSASEVVGIILQACDAIAEAHALGIVHRDLKPANLFLAERPGRTNLLKVLDFGISKAQVGSGVSLTLSASLVGSPLYMSPEQVREARTVDGRADVWALGVTAYQLLTGTTPFAAPAIGEICAKILMENPVPPRSRWSEVPVQLDAVVMRCLRKEPSERYSSVRDLVQALEDAEKELATDPFTTKPAAGVPETATAALGVGGTTATIFGENHPAVDTGVSAAGTVPPHAPRAGTARVRKSITLGVAVGCGLSALALSFFVWRGSPRAHGDNRSAAAQPPFAQPRVLASSMTTSKGPADQPASEPVIIALSATASAVASASGSSGSSGKPMARPMTAAGPSAKPNCTIVTSFDSEGQPHFKKVCK
jgi:predicted Ser/Thr protein kinase